jgi:hypothetical protein
LLSILKNCTGVFVGFLTKPVFIAQMMRTLLLTTDVAYNIRCFLSKSVFEGPNVADTAADNAAYNGEM